MYERKGLITTNRIYYIDNLGNVVNQYGHTMSQYDDKDGYKYVLLLHNGKRRKFFVHRLIAMMFIENPESLPQINHIDGNKGNNSINNLEWVTNSQNQIHSRYVLKNVTGFADTPVMCVETGKHFISTRDAWRKTGVSYSHISECVNKRRKSAGGLHWERLEGDSN